MKRILFLSVASLLTCASAARADDPPPPPTSRVSIFPLVGVGYAHVSKSNIFPSDIGTTSFGLELAGSVADFGGLLRAEFMSSGGDGRWTAMSYGAGPTWRLFGDGYESLAIVARAGLLYEHWRASTSGCDVLVFVPNNCKDFVPPPGSGVVNPPPPSFHLGFDAVGLFAGARFELPIHSQFFVAVDAELAPLLELGDASGILFHARTLLVLGLRSRRGGGVAIEPQRIPRGPRGGSY